MPELILRPAVPEDAPILAHIQTEAWNAAFGGILSPEALAQATQLEEAQSMHAYVLEHRLAHVSLQCVDGVPQGMTAWSENRDNLGAEVAELICIHSLPQFWGHGYGAHMIQHVLEEAKHAGYLRLVLWVFEANDRARRFYEKQGFHLTDRKQENLGATEVMYEITL